MQELASICERPVSAKISAFAGELIGVWGFFGQGVDEIVAPFREEYLSIQP